LQPQIKSKEYSSSQINMFVLRRARLILGLVITFGVSTVLVLV